MSYPSAVQASNPPSSLGNSFMEHVSRVVRSENIVSRKPCLVKHSDDGNCSIKHLRFVLCPLGNDRPVAFKDSAVV